MATAGIDCLVQISGTSTAFTGEAFTGADDTWQITSASKRVWDHATIPTFYDNGVEIASGDIESIDYLLGRVVFTGSKTGPITADGAYFPLYTITEAHEFTLSLSREMLDKTVFGNSYRQRLPGLIDASGDIALYNSLTEDLDTTGGTRTLQAVIDNGTPVVLSFRLSSDANNIIRLWALFSTVESEAGLEDLVNRTVSFELDAKSDSAGRHVGVSYQHS